MPQQPLDYERQLPKWTPHRRVRAAMIIGPLLVGSVLPIWTAWYVGPWEATGEIGTLWSALRMLPDNVRASGFSYVASLYASNVMMAGMLLLLGFGVERFFVVRGRRAAA